MLSKNFFTQAGRRVALTAGQFILIVICINYIFYSYHSNVRPDKYANKHYKPANCFIISKRLSSRTTNNKWSLFKGYRADFLISYTVNGTQYNRWVSGNGLDESFTRDQEEQENILSNYDVGGHYPCRYNPANPQFSLLVPRHDWLSTLPLMLPTVLLLLLIYYFTKNMTVYFKEWRDKLSVRRTTRKRKK